MSSGGPRSWPDRRRRAAFACVTAALALTLGLVTGGSAGADLLPSTSLPTVSLPTVSVPSTTVPSTTVPSVTVPTAPSTPTAPSLPTVKTPTVTTPKLPSTNLSSPTSTSGGASTPSVTSPGLPSAGNLLRTTTSTLSSAPGSTSALSGGLGGAAPLGGGPGAGPAALGGPYSPTGPAALAGRSARGPAAWQSLDPARASLAQLAAAVAELRGCLYALSDLERGVVVLRTGVLDGRPRSRGAVGRRVGLSPRGVKRVERRALGKLQAKARADGCAGPPGAAALAAGADLVSPLVAALVGTTGSAAAPGVATRAGFALPGPPALDPQAPQLRNLRADGLDWKLIGPVLLVLAMLAGLLLMMTGAALGGARPAPYAANGRGPNGYHSPDEATLDWESQLQDVLADEREPVGGSRR